MFYILNQNEQIAAADRELLDAIKLNNLQELCGSILTNEITFKKLNTHKIDIIARNITIKASYEEFELLTPFGDVKLIKLSNIFTKSIIDNFEDCDKKRETTSKVEYIKPVEQKKVSSFLEDDISAEKNNYKKEKEVVAKTAHIFLDDEDIEKDILIDKPLEIEKKEPKLDITKSTKEESTLDNLDKEFHLKGLDLDTLINKEPIEEVKEELEKEPKKPVSSFLFEEDEPVKEEKSEEFAPISLDDYKDEIEEEEISSITLDNSTEDDEDEESVESMLLNIQEDEEPEEEFSPISLDDDSTEDNEDEESVESMLLNIQEDEEPEEEFSPISLDDNSTEEDEEDDISVESMLLNIAEEEKEEELSTINLDESEEDEKEIEEFDDLLLEVEKKPEPPIQEEPQEDIEEFDDLLLEVEKEPKPSIVEEPQEDIEEFDDLLSDVKKESIPTKEEPEEDIEEFDDLFGDTTVEKKAPVAPKPSKPAKVYECNDVIEINLDEYGEMMGISGDDYTLFLNEFIDKSIMYDEELRSSNDEERKDAIDELYGIAQSLQIPYLEDILYDMLESDDADDNIIDAFFACLGQIITVSAPTPEENISEEVENLETEEEIVQDSNSFGTLDFDGIKPIHFDFRLEEAADDLSLPVDLIEEFVNDFIVQAIEEKDTFIKAYHEGDLDTIQKTGHKLKGASSNLRIVPLSETLEDIQHCEDPERLLPLLKKYWGQFLSFELFMQNISHN